MAGRDDWGLTKEQYARSNTRWTRYRVFGTDPKANDLDYQFGHDAVYPSEHAAILGAGRLRKKWPFYETRIIQTPSGAWGFEYRKTWEAVQEERKHPKFFRASAPPRRRGRKPSARLTR